MLNFENLYSDKRTGKDKNFENSVRSEYQRDYDRLIFSSSFRRLQNKTQVFPLPGSSFVHNRLTHSLEVSTVGRSLGKKVSLRVGSASSPPAQSSSNNLFILFWHYCSCIALRVLPQAVTLLAVHPPCVRAAPVSFTQLHSFALHFIHCTMLSIKVKFSFHCI